VIHLSQPNRDLDHTAVGRDRTAAPDAAWGAENAHFVELSLRAQAGYTSGLRWLGCGGRGRLTQSAKFFWPVPAYVTKITSNVIGLSYRLTINTLSSVTARMTTMTSLHRLFGIKAIATIGVALSMTAGLAFAGDTNVSKDQILNALQPKPLTRGLSAGPQVDPAVKAKENHFVETLRNRKTRSLSLGEREEILQIASDKPKIDLDIQFDYNSADISTTSMPSVKALGEALSNASLKGSTFVVAGHTDAIGGEAYNQGLSERRADTIKRYLVEKYGITGADLVTVGYGKDKPKDANAPMDPINRRVQVVNMDTKTTASR
jgi:outer membrane protein OmpA-like peptidoglycan-associated protein